MVVKKVTNASLRKEAAKVLVGGVNSPVRAFRYAGVDQLVIKRGQGAYVWDQEGKKYIDHVCGYGSVMLGHGNKSIALAVQRALKNGTVFGATTGVEVELASLIRDAISVMEQVRFVNSGTEAVMSAIRLARGVTGRKYVLKFEHSYHGHADYLLSGAGSGVATLGIPASAGVPEEFAALTLTIPHDRTAIEKVFRKHGHQIAAVVVEPVGGNWGVIAPSLDLLGYLSHRSARAGALFIADEMITGFRFGAGSYCMMNGIVPDIVCLGKIIGGGLPIGAYGASKRIMSRLAPEGDVYQGSTFGGNAAVMAAGVAALRQVLARKKDVLHLADHAYRIAQAFIATYDGRVKVVQVGAMFSIRFTEKKEFQRVYAALLRAGIYLAPSEYEANFVSLAHSSVDVARTIKAIKTSLKEGR